MKASQVPVEKMPNFNPVLIHNVLPQNYETLKQAGGTLVKEIQASHNQTWGTFSFPQGQVAGQVWVGFQTPQNARNRYEVGGLVILTHPRYATEVSRKEDGASPTVS